ncbi:glycosyltransferase [Candidatus Gracilibacteria bacterium]|nr:glycosyltransferase [Candidatus Gracilibacteria bacterium]
MLDLSIIIVSWNTRDLLDRCLRQLYAAANDFAIEVFVVDNASHDGSQELVRECYPQATLISNDANLGFVRANNQALPQAQGELCFCSTATPFSTWMRYACWSILCVLTPRPVRLGHGCVTPMAHFSAPAPRSRHFGMNVVGCCSSIVWRPQALFLLAIGTMVGSTTRYVKSIRSWVPAFWCATRRCSRSVSSMRITLCTPKRSIGAIGSSRRVGVIILYPLPVPSTSGAAARPGACRGFCTVLSQSAYVLPQTSWATCHHCIKSDFWYW